MNAIGSRVLVACAEAGVMAKLAAVGFADFLIAEPAPPARPQREPGKCICGRTISLNKPFCRACALRIEGHMLARRLAASIPNQEALDEVLKQAGEKRGEVLERIRPFLRFRPAEKANDMRTATYNGFRILSNGVLVRRLPDEEKTGSLFIPETADRARRNRQAERMAFGEVLAVGDGHPIRKGPRAGEKRALTVQAGEKVLFIPCPPNDEITVDGEKLWVVHEDHVLGIVE